MDTITKYGLGFGQFVDVIKDYESDTFSAEGSEITATEAQQVACRLINWLVENRLDGVMIDGMLSDIRNGD